ncbi:MAG: hypothetical protein J2P37_13495 [Ktedonobacteraceae bacterium]|nr:hypothetical protein [Ktedonobacteraceae bacterium]MBO0796023.1 hypothetical protein [Ktedonobacteraceae bacterium]
MFYKASYRRGVIEGVIIYTLGRLCSLISPAVFPGWTYVAAPLLFLVLQYLLAPAWATRRIASTKRERLSKRFVLLGPLMAAICTGVDLVITLALGMPTGGYGTQHGSALLRLLANDPNRLSVGEFMFHELTTILALFALFTLIVVCSRLARGGFLRFTMPAGGNRVTL